MKSLLLFSFLMLISYSVADEIKEEIDLAPLEEALEKRALYSSVIANVTQHKTLPSLSEPLVTKGKLWLVPETAFRWEQGIPPIHTALFKDNTVYLLDEHKQTVETHKT